MKTGHFQDPQCPSSEREIWMDSLVGILKCYISFLPAAVLRGN